MSNAGSGRIFVGPGPTVFIFSDIYFQTIFIHIRFIEETQTALLCLALNNLHLILRDRVFRYTSHTFKSFPFTGEILKPWKAHNFHKLTPRDLTLHSPHDKRYKYFTEMEQKSWSPYFITSTRTLNLSFIFSHIFITFETKAQRKTIINV